jgi:ATP phosphoribosyltransferase
VSDPLLIAVPSKGRLQENAQAFFARSGLHVQHSGGQRGYRGHLKGVSNVEIAFLSASDIANQLAQGAVHFGITGEDLIREQVLDVEHKLALLCPLGFGHATVVLAVPQAWIDVQTMSDLEEVATDMRARGGLNTRLRIATKYHSLTRQFLATHSLADYTLIDSPGATEGAPAAGMADIIVDITTTGATLAANGLKILQDGHILKSEAMLVVSKTASWTEETKKSAHQILARISAEEEARVIREVQAEFTPEATVPESLQETLQSLANQFQAQVHQRTPVQATTVTLHCPTDHVFDLVQSLQTAGFGTVTVRTLDYVFRRENALASVFDKAVG